MQQTGNPFTPTFGHAPFALAGRTDQIDDIIGGLANIPGDPNRSTILVGPRGSGKTVLMRTIEDEASQMGWVCVHSVCHAGIDEQLRRQLRYNAAHLLSRGEETSHITSVTLGPVGLEREIRSTDFDYRIDMTEMIEELNNQGIGVLFVIDEVNPTVDDLVKFIQDYQLFVYEDRDVALLMAGLPGKVSDLLIDSRVSFVRRAFQQQLGAIDYEDVEHALATTIRDNSRDIEPDALRMAAEATKGFAYAIQLIGFYLWSETRHDGPFTVADVEVAAEWMRHALEHAIFIPTLREITQREEEYLRAMVADDGPSATGDIARRMGISNTNASNIRRRLMAHSLIREARYGQVEFELPMFKDYLRG